MASSIMTLELSALESREPSPPTLDRKTIFGASSQALNEVTDDPLAVISKRRAAAIIITVAGVNFLDSVGSGLLTVALPTIAEDLGLSKELLLWYVPLKTMFIFEQSLIKKCDRPASIYA